MNTNLRQQNLQLYLNITIAAHKREIYCLAFTLFSHTHTQKQKPPSNLIQKDGLADRKRDHIKH